MSIFSFNKPGEHVDFNWAGVCSEVSPASLSPIDEYMQNATKSIKMSVSSGVKGDSRWLGLLLLDLTSCAEWYFRRFIAGCSAFCPESRALLGGQQIQIGSLEYYSKNTLSFSALENYSFTSSDEIRKRTNAILGFQVRDSDDVSVALNGFDKVCQLRHALVHARGRLWYKNVRELGLDRVCDCEVILSDSAFQDATMALHVAVRTYNNFYGNKLVERMIAKNHLKGKWKEDKILFTDMYRFLNSGSESADSRVPYHAYMKVRKVIRNRS